ncbi:Uncharacterized protein TCM_016576 [Theobroma cacao]|uniref:Uncharacterized protein n=1 Tax=Theobroma cacao TaxID=3641 RepID=A0A061G6L2_THECC|nr:Uncharacterized protein TCM_016576 [Theobroma cacao]
MVLWEITLGTAYFLGLKRTYRLALRIQRRIISPEHPRIRQFVQRNLRLLAALQKEIRRVRVCCLRQVSSYALMLPLGPVTWGLFALPTESRMDMGIRIQGMFATFLMGEMHLRTRAAFDVALKVHQNIQQRDLEVGRNLGNWILRWLDKMKPSAQIRVPPQQKPHHHAGNAKMNISKQVINSHPLKTHGSIQTPRNHEADRHLFSTSTYMWSKSLPTIAMMMRLPTAAGNMIQYRHLSINGPDTLRLNYTRGEGVIRKDIMQWMLHK